ncbi:MAG: tRNA (adenosine(37)-N6)-threonylcarbamoyltransferase complex dimerization subunit type 1 TsaB [Sulfobacillus acidophilus]|uniref:tRNA (Adenosine(37)-N6)-threonylcarbamoyltransferase complex dimerization subunit type 1 TsaB n=1 Tax=Sulfobacillus acidophilus TaxID=53633 RepID=A0A2T2WDZ7_9FIRM|nr:MAG: tRNA (adenosine(37)-N6)-threonylcarbamoyltransferase complex dimerization subunit type 1 TsaB [Sulfobacillus acidophilus]
MGFKVMGWDASTPVLAVGYIEDGEPVANMSARGPRLAGTILVEWIDRLVKLYGRPDALAVGVGPGSFTGVRVALSAAKAYSLGWNVPLVGVSSLAAWAEVVLPGRRVVVTSERRGMAFYLGYYWVDVDGAQALMPDVAVQGRLPLRFPLAEEVTVLGPAGADAALLRQIGRVAHPDRRAISGVPVAMRGWSRLQWKGADDPVGLAPTYLRSVAISRPNEVDRHGAS